MRRISILGPLSCFDIPSKECCNTHDCHHLFHLQACARLGIKVLVCCNKLATLLFCMLTQPVELLPKSFPKLKQGLHFTGFSLSDAYLEYETQRKEKLRAVKSERARLKQAEQRLQWQDTSTRESIDQCKHEKTDTALPDKVYPDIIMYPCVTLRLTEKLWVCPKLETSICEASCRQLMHSA